MTESRFWTDLLARPDLLERWEGYARRQEEKLHCFLQLDPRLAREQSAAEGPLRGVPFAVKDNIAVRGFRLTCASRLLEDYLCPYTATAVRRLQDQGAVVVGKTNLDEFGMGSSTQGSALALTRNPWDPQRVPGGSSGGSAAAVAAGIVPFALGSDTGGSIRQPASFCGVYGLKPTYGSVSRFGLVAYASSLEVVGVVAATVDWARTAFGIMRGRDPRDHSSLDCPTSGPLPRRIRVGVPSLPSEGAAGVALHPEVARSFAFTQETLAGMGVELEPVELPALRYAVSSYYVIACAEASANLARFDAVRYGKRAQETDNPEELVRLSRSRGLGEEVKLRILLGTYVLRSGFQDQYYLRAQRIRTALRRDFDAAFQRVNLILMPVYPSPPFPFGEEGLDPFTQKLSDIFTGTANLAGLPAMSFPATLEKGLPVGMQFLGPACSEELLFHACERFAERVPPPDSPLASTEWSRQ